MLEYFASVARNFGMYLNLVDLEICLSFPSSGTCSSLGIIFVSVTQFREKVAVDLHLVVLADRDGAYVVLVAQL